MAGLADHLLVVPSDTTARIQEMHITLGQMLCGALEIELGLAKPRADSAHCSGITRFAGCILRFHNCENSVRHAENALTQCRRPISLSGQGETNHGRHHSAGAAEPKPARRARAPSGDRHSIQSVDRALFLLETIAEAGGEATLTDLRHRTGLNISTCHHLLATLIQRGFAAKVPGRRLYALGARILYLGHACLQVDLPRRAQPYLEAINQATGETVHLAALQGDAVVTLAVREARHAVRVDTGKIGKRGSAARHLGRQGDPGLAAGRRNPAASLGRRHEALHRQHHHRISGADRIAAHRAPHTATPSTARNSCPA